ncbi:MAG: CAP domain-containing protein [Actinomycetota bacterium]
MGRRVGAALAVALTAALLLTASPSSASSAQEADFVSRINAERAAAGLSAVASKTDLADVAREWAQHMAAEGTIAHDPNLPYKVSGWTMLGDNVGKGPSVSSIHKAFMESDTHRHIILDPDFNQVGVGVAQAGSILYVAEVFARRTGSGSAAPAPKPKPKPVTAPIENAVIGLTGRIWSVDLTAPPVTVDVLMQLVALDA